MSHKSVQYRMMKPLLLAVALCTFSAVAYAQTDSTKTAAVSCPPYEAMPEYPGGESEMRRFVQGHVVYPADAQEEEVQGRVYVKFTVDADGSISNVRVARGLHPSLDREAVRVIKLMPKWKPGCSEGKPVAVDYTYPFTFMLR